MPGPYPLATLACTVDENGISAPDYADIYASLKASYYGIYGSDADLDEDAQDGQWIAVIAKAQDDANQMAIATYNNFSPATAVGVGLSSVVKTNGIERDVPQQSQVDVVITGTVGTTITDGVVGDNLNLGTQWQLPSSVTIPYPSATITVQATCTQQGAVAAAPDSLTVILTPVPGWATANNPSAAVPGAPVESDADLRQRQSISAAGPAVTPLNSIEAVVAAVTGVLRSTGYQNDTNTTDANEIPAHNIAIVAEGGDPIAVATAIALKKPPGIPTYGTTTETVLDSKGVPDMVNFFQLSVVEASVYIAGTALSGYVSGTGALIQAALAGYLGALAIGANADWSKLWSPANLSGTAAILAYLAANGITDSATARQAAQVQLDALSATYDLSAPLGLAQARADMVVQGGPFNAGATTIDVTNTANYATGKTIYVVLNDGSFFATVVQSVSGVAVGISPAIPSGKHASNGALVYVVGDVAYAFNEAANAVSTDVTTAIS